MSSINKYRNRAGHRNKRGQVEYSYDAVVIVVRVVVESSRIAVGAIYQNKGAMLTICDYIVIVLLYIHKLLHI